MNKIANSLLNCEAIHIKPNEKDYFTWTSGKRSPIYCDNRQLISYPEHRKMIVLEFVKYIKKNYNHVDIIAGTATAGIPWAAWIADELNLNMVYIRSKPKGHGLKSAIEGKITEGQTVLIIEDLISTGKSSIEAINHAKDDKLNVLGVLSIFNYEFKESIETFKVANTSFHSLCNLDQLTTEANAQNLISAEEVDYVLEWKKSFS